MSLMNLQRWLVMVVAVLSSVTVQAQLSTDTLSIRFRLDSTRVNLVYADNARAWERFERSFHEHYSSADPRTLRLDIYSGASPEGSAAHNRWLGENRGVAIRHLVRQRLGNSVGSIIIHNEAARWDGLYEAIRRSSEPWRDEALRIIELPASPDENQWDHREYKLRALRGGSVWPVLLEKYLAPLRSGATAILSWQTARDTVVVRDTIVMAQPVYIRYDSLGVDDFEEVPEKRKPVLRWPVWALKTNLPLLGTGTPNLQAEFSLGHKDKWSINVEGVWSWWTFSRNAFANEIIYGSAELRRYLGRRYRHHTLDGWHIGLGVGGGYGDLEWRSKGYQAEVYSAYVNIGWQRRFGRRKQWAFDMGFGFGFAHIDWRRYDGSTLFPVGKEEKYDDHLMWQETGRTNWPGAVHANISIAYVFPQHDAKWRREKANARDAERNARLHLRDSLEARGKFERDSIEIARKQRLKEIDLLPKPERKLALQQLKAEQWQAKVDAKLARQQAKLERQQAKRQAKIDKRMAKQRAKAEKRERKVQLMMEKSQRKREKLEIELWSTTPEGIRAIEQQKIADKAAKRQAKAERRQAERDAKAAKRQAELERKQAKMRQRIEFEHRQNLEKLQRQMERTDQKYNQSENR